MSDETSLLGATGDAELLPGSDEDHVEEDLFHDLEGNTTLGDADPFEVAVYAHHCWRLNQDPDAVAAELGAI